MSKTGRALSWGLGVLALALVSVLLVNVIAAMRWNTKREPWAFIYSTEHMVSFERYHGFGREFINWTRYRRYTGPDALPPQPEGSPPEWSQLHSVARERLGDLPSYGAQVALGWPALCVAGDVARTAMWGTRSPGPKHVIVVRGLELPYRPLWPGLLINVLTHAAAWSVVLPTVTWSVRTTWRAIVRHRRKDNGLCMNCGYDVYDQPSGSKCPECGEARW